MGNYYNYLNRLLHANVEHTRQTLCVAETAVEDIADGLRVMASKMKVKPRITLRDLFDDDQYTLFLTENDVIDDYQLVVE